MTKLIIANWKAFNGMEVLTKFKDFVAPHSNEHDFIICPPAPLIGLIDPLKMHVNLGAQDCSPFEKGAHTGEITAELLKEVGVNYCLVGHSERRQECNETEEILSHKLAQIIKADLTPIFCIGEKEADRNEGRTESVLLQQLLILSGLKPKQLIIAYEPVWAIGSGKIPTETEIQAVQQFLKEDLDSDFQFLYGGSVSKDNVKSILSIPGVDGVLVGRASTDPVELAGMV